MVIECRLDDETAKSRLGKRLEEGSVSDGRWEIFESQKKDFDNIEEFPPQNHIVIDTSQPISDIVKIIIEESLES